MEKKIISLEDYVKFAQEYTGPLAGFINNVINESQVSDADLNIEINDINFAPNDDQHDRIMNNNLRVDSENSIVVKGNGRSSGLMNGVAFKNGVAGEVLLANTDKNLVYARIREDGRFVSEGPVTTPVIIGNSYPEGIFIPFNKQAIFEGTVFLERFSKERYLTEESTEYDDNGLPYAPFEDKPLSLTEGE